jgi:hypothetical protein
MDKGVYLFEEEMLKPHLYQLIKRNEPHTAQKVDRIFYKRGHTVLNSTPLNFTNGQETGCREKFHLQVRRRHYSY